MNVEETPRLQQDAASESLTEMASLEVLDHEHIEWKHVRRTAFLIHQYLRYDYSGPIADLNHRLVIVPPTHHLDQSRIVHRLDVSSPDAGVTTRSDSFGNVVVDVQVPVVEGFIEFEAWIVAERRTGVPSYLQAGDVIDERLLAPSSRTHPDEALRQAAADLRAGNGSDIELVRHINSWVYGHMNYAHDVTDIHTTAADALSRGRGVCQDFAHVMIALCRLCDIPARYVSGHLLGEGGTHAWVEVLLPEPPHGTVRVWPFDPTHDREPGLSYVTIAIGRDYADVAPTSGTFRSSHNGRLSTRKRVGLTAVEYESVG
ncbi:MAG: transglutaminase family protein [Chloroflexota bacterium]